MTINDDNSLAHYGVKGMKWGKRKGGNTKPRSQDAARVERLQTRAKKNSIKNLSNKELSDVIRRRELETKYKDLNPNAIKKGERAIKSVIAAGALAASVVALANNPAVKAGISAMQKFKG